MDSQDFEKRLRRLEDIEEIKQIQAHYVNCLTTANYDELLKCFTDDAVIDLHAGLARGRKEFTPLFRENIGEVHRGQEGPFAVHPIISVDGDQAKGSWLLYIQYALPRKMEHRPETYTTDDAPDWMQGFYEMEYKRVDGQWKISFLKWRLRLCSPITHLKSDHAS